MPIPVSQGPRGALTVAPLPRMSPGAAAQPGFAIADIGREAVATGEALARRLAAERDRTAALDAARVLGETRVDLTGRLATAQESAPAGAPDFAQGFDQELDEALAARLEAAPPDARPALELRFERLREDLRLQARGFEARSRAKKRATDLDSAVSLQLNAIRSDPDQFAAALADAEAAIAVSALPADVKIQVRDDTRGRAARALVENLNDTAPLRAKEILDGDELDAFLTPEDKSTLIAGNEVELRRREAELRAAAAEQRRELGQRVNDAVFVLRRGATPTDLARLQDDVAGNSDLDQALGDAVADSAFMAEFLRLPPAAQAAEAAALAGQATHSRRELARLDAMRDVQADALKALQNDPLPYAARIGAIAGDLQALDFSEPATLVRRRVQADAASAFFGIEVPVLREVEADALGGAIESAESDQVAALFQSLAAGFGRDRLDQVAGQIAPKRPAVAVALSRAELSPLVASRIVAGQRLLRATPDVKPGPAEREASVRDIYGALFQEVPSALQPHIEAALAVYAGGKVPGGDFEFDEDLFEEALRLVAGGTLDARGEQSGGPVEFNGRRILPPVPGMTADQVMDLTESLTFEDLQIFGNGQPVFADGRAFDAGLFDAGVFQTDAQLLTIGPGLYQVFLPGLGSVLNPLGEPYELDLRRALRGRGLP